MGNWLAYGTHLPDTNSFGKGKGNVNALPERICVGQVLCTVRQQVCMKKVAALDVLSEVKSREL
jgi:hypothetical protein